MKTLLDKNFKYVPSVKTDIAKTFRRVRREMTQQMGVSPLRSTPGMYEPLPFGMTDEELYECQEILRQDYDNLGDPWNPEVKHG